MLSAQPNINKHFANNVMSGEALLANLGLRCQNERSAAAPGTFWMKGKYALISRFIRWL
jgi:hypothetical protein